jgi:hypothetical protein
MSVRVTYTPKTPLQYFLSAAISLNGDCINVFCAFSGENQNNITISKKASTVLFYLNRDPSSGNLYALGDTIFAGKCNAKAYAAEYLFSGTSSIKVQVRENYIIIKDEAGEDYHEIAIGGSKKINSLAVALYSVNTKTNDASIGAMCA